MLSWNWYVCNLQSFDVLRLKAKEILENGENIHWAYTEVHFLPFHVLTALPGCLMERFNNNPWLQPWQRPWWVMRERARCWAVLPCQKKLPSNRNVFKCSMMYTCMHFLYICITFFLEVLYWQQQNPFLTPTWQPVFCIANQNTSNKVLFFKNVKLFQASNHKEAGIPCWGKERLGKSFSPGLCLLPSPNILLAVVHSESSYRICAGLICSPLPSLLLPQPIQSFFSPLPPRRWSWPLEVFARLLRSPLLQEQTDSEDGRWPQQASNPSSVAQTHCKHNLPSLQHLCFLALTQLGRQVSPALFAAVSQHDAA